MPSKSQVEMRSDSAAIALRTGRPILATLWRSLVREPFVVAVTLLAAFYVAAAWSPSGYSRVLKWYDVEDHGLVVGWPQQIRSDEYAIWTPTIQAVVANDFGPINETSFYHERFRSLTSMPLRDWGLLFKPEFWPFFLLSPARAYSAYHAFHAWALLVGWCLFFRRLGVGRGSALFGAVLLFASPWVQFWWTSLAPVVAIAPWLGLLALIRVPGPVRVAAAAFVTAVWLLDGILYPPLILVTALAMGLAIAAFRPAALRPALLLQMALAVLLGGGIAAAYLWEPLRETAATVTHGQRHIGGGSVPWQNWLGTFLPSFPFRGWKPLFGGNTCESGAAGSILWLLLLAFVRPSPVDGAEVRRRLRGSVGLLALFAAATAWMLCPIPPLLGRPLLWSLMPATRLLLVPGLVSLFFALLWLPVFTFRWSWWRALAASGVIVAARVAWQPKGRATDAWRIENGDLILIAIVWSLPLLELLRRRLRSTAPDGAPSGWRNRVRPSLGAATLLAGAAVANLLLFGLFNPIQSSKPIFAAHDTPQLRALQSMQAAHPQGVLVVGGAMNYFGSILNGLGFRSVNHSLLTPQLERFRRIFPTLSEQDLQTTFNRDAIIQVGSRLPPDWRFVLKTPVVVGENAVIVPVESFLPPLPVELSPRPSAGAATRPGSSTRMQNIVERDVELEVIGPIRGISGGSSISIHTDPAAESVVGSWRMPTSFGVEALGPELYSVLLIRLRFPRVFPNFGPDAGKLAWCVSVHDPISGAWQVAPDPALGGSTCVPAPPPPSGPAAHAG